MRLGRIRAALKAALSRVRCVPSYCHDCGRNVRDYIAPDWAWRRAWGADSRNANGAGVLCYECFADRCPTEGVTWQLVTRREGAQNRPGGLEMMSIDECPECGSWVPGAGGDLTEGNLLECLGGCTLVVGVDEAGQAFLEVDDWDQGPGCDRVI